MLPFLLLLCSADSLALFPPDKKPADKRLTAVRNLNDKDFFLKVPATRDAWAGRANAVRQQILVSQGLWPMWPREKLAPAVLPPVARDGYTVEAVSFASTPGHYVTGSLYRPAGKAGKRPAVLVAHGHWAEGRMHDAGEVEAKKALAIKAESHLPNARFFLQSKCAHLARLGCVVFQYDMIGYADSKVLGHAAFADADAELRLQNLMGLQSFNSLRALDFLASLPDVDATRIGMTGASGGGTQTFITAAIDPRIAAAVPAVMVSTQMQGGCVCENASYLRVGTGNVEFAAAIAPRPRALTGANDWTIEIEKKGFPELQGVYRLFDAEGRVKARCWPEFLHNYNQPARQFAYEFFNEHLKLGHPTPIVEPAFEPLTRAEQTAYPTKEARPA
ncbi:MAG: alpha/beta hydrolase family protein, partial [Gemmataceae bacterium]